jgi:hypothetical protein
MMWEADAHAEEATRVRQTHMQEKNTCKTDAHAEEEGMQGTHARRPSQDRVRVLVRECNGW